MPSSCLQNCPRNSSYALRSSDSFGGTRTAFFPESLGKLWHYIPLCIHATLIMHDWLRISFKLRIYRDSSLLDSLYEMFDMSWMKKYVIINIRFIINCQTGPRAESFNLQTLFTACLHKHFSVHYIKSHKYENIT